MSRSSILSLTIALLMLVITVPLFAQATADIALGGGLVARLRDKGPFASVDQRAASVEKKICDIVSYKDTLHPQVSTKQVNGLWTVYAWDVAVFTVYPAEAKANGLTEKALSTRWADTLREQLPKATPCSKLPPEMLGYGKKPATPATPLAAKPAPAAVPVKPVTTAPTASVALTDPAPVKVAATKPVAIKPVTPASETALQGSESGAMLLIVDAMRAAREMNDQDWSANKEKLAKDLYVNLSYYLTGKGIEPKPATTPVTKPAPVSVPKPSTAKPVSATVQPPAKPVATVPTPVKTGPTAKVVAPKVVAPAPKPDASTARVPQKNRIREKLLAAKDPLDKLEQTDPETAKSVSALVSASRQAYAAGKFDEAEQQIDEALTALGVTPKP